MAQKPLAIWKIWEAAWGIVDGCAGMGRAAALRNWRFLA
jgi:hypothetical protein